MERIETEIGIATAPSHVWRVLTRFDRYGDWNPFIKTIEGRPALGEAITVHVSVAGVSLPIKAEIVSLRENEELVWRSHLLREGFFDRDHIIRLQASATGTLVTQTQTFEGPVAPVAAALTADLVRHGLDHMNAGLKRHLEVVGTS